jgi:uncharacterized protein YndB with AHSA1/START domain
MTETTTDLAAIERTIELKASPERVWRAISDPAELGRWFPQRAEWDLAEGGEGSFHFDGYGDFAVRVEAVDAPRYLAWRWPREAGGDPVGGRDSTLVEWWVEGRPDGGTTLRIRESGFSDPGHRTGNEEGWTEELAELTALVDG